MSVHVIINDADWYGEPLVGIAGGVTIGIERDDDHAQQFQPVRISDLDEAVALRDALVALVGAWDAPAS